MGGLDADLVKEEETELFNHLARAPLPLNAGPKKRKRRNAKPDKGENKIDKQADTADVKIDVCAASFEHCRYLGNMTDVRLPLSQPTKQEEGDPIPTKPPKPVPVGWGWEVDTETKQIFYFHTDKNNCSQWAFPTEPWHSPEETIEAEEALPERPLATTHENVKVGDKVLCYQGRMVYETVILSLESEIASKIHYQGWSKKHDEVVLNENFVTLDEQGLALQKWELLRFKIDQKREKMSKQKKTKKKPKPPPKHKDKPRKRQRTGENKGSANQEADVETELVEEVEEKPKPKPKPPRHVQKEKDYYHGDPEVRVPMPDELRLQMAQDWKNITVKRLLLKLPSCNPISSILDGYCNHAEKKGWSSMKVAARFSEALKDLFRDTIQECLLYPQEMSQYASATSPTEELEYGADPCDLYGSEHLLRLFAKLPQPLAQTNLNRVHMESQVKCLVEIMKFLDSKSDQFFLSDKAYS